MKLSEHIARRLQAEGLSLPPAHPTAFSYLPAMRHGNVVHVAGQIPKTSKEDLVCYGVVGAGVTHEQAILATKHCMLNALAWLVECVQDDLEAIDQVTRVNYFFQVPEQPYARMSQLADAGSDLLVTVFGDRGRHVRSVLGVRELPRQSPVLVDMDVALRK